MFCSIDSSRVTENSEGRNRRAKKMSEVSSINLKQHKQKPFKTRKFRRNFLVNSLTNKCDAKKANCYLFSKCFNPLKSFFLFACTYIVSFLATSCPPASSTKVSRSGRTIKPPLEYWKGGRVILDAHMNVTIHEAYDTSICIPVRKFSSSRFHFHPDYIFIH